ncbi:MAG: AbrB/MazE/SpoVT family DNA-binding domain-containing protein [Vallitaleaceae bacterium]|jgi:transcriptional pleiotropic regulator of transition state genes|nr:AbrB/MazE/SpoVT family DNA-binding domain-containing protein [Vallitaleaceae bacterium]
MFTTGYVRKVDSLGRITIPADLRKKLSISYDDSVEIFIRDQMLVIRKYAPGDIFTGNTKNLISYRGKRISKESIEEMATLAGLSITSSKSTSNS